MKLEPNYTRLALIWRVRGEREWSTYKHYSDDEAGQKESHYDLRWNIGSGVESHIVRVVATEDQTGWIVGQSLGSNPESTTSCPPRIVDNPVTKEPL